MIDREEAVNGLESISYGKTLPDAEKVIEAIENCIWMPKCRDCPWEDCEELVNIPESLAKAAYELLKEQEPVAPVMVPHSRGIAYNCGACGTEIAVIRDTLSANYVRNGVRYCHMCGRAVKWDAAD